MSGAPTRARGEPKPVFARVVGDRSGRVWPHVLEAVRQARNTGTRVVVYVPEQLTLQVERDLIADLRLPGLLNLDVISPRKLKQQVRETAGSAEKRELDAAGEAMVVYSALRSTEKDLAYYAGSGSLGGAAEKLGAALRELRESGLELSDFTSAADAAQTSAERAKYHDLNALWQAYDLRVGGRFSDRVGAWNDTLMGLEESGLWRGVSLLVYGFDSVRPDLRDLLLRASRFAADAQVFLTMDDANSPEAELFEDQRRSVADLESAFAELGLVCKTLWLHGAREGMAPELAHLENNLFSGDPTPWTDAEDGSLSLYSAACPGEEAGNAADTLAAWHAAGIPWERMAVALPKGSRLDSALLAALRLRNIPFHDNRKRSMSEHGVSRMLIAALRCARDGMRTEHVQAMISSGFAPLEAEEAGRLEAYALAHGIDRGKWLKPFQRGDDAAEAEALREKMIGPVAALREALKAAPNGEAAIRAIISFLQDTEIWNRLQARQERLMEERLYDEAVMDRQVWTQLMGLLDELWALEGQRRIPLRDMADMLENAVTQTEIAALPEEAVGVSVGTIGHMLAGRLDAMILMDITEGTLAASGGGWLTDGERERLEASTHCLIGMSREREARLHRYDFYRTLSLPEKRLRISWSLKGEDGAVRQPDGIIQVLRELHPNLVTEGGLTRHLGTEVPRTPQSALTGLTERLAAMKAGDAEELPSAWREAAANLLRDPVLGQTTRRVLRMTAGGEEHPPLDADTARTLFLANRISISRLERFASCPYRHFVDYGLRPGQRKAFDFEAKDAGDYYHAVLDQFMKRATRRTDWPNISDFELEGMLDVLCAEQAKAWEDGPLQEDAPGRWRGDEVERRARFAAKAVTRFAANSDFRPLVTEQAFGAQSEWKPLTLRLTDGGRVALGGIIDRVDTWLDGRDIWARVNDNKSREMKPQAAKLDSGEQLQLLIYLRAALENMPNARPAGAFYFPVRDDEIRDEDEDNPEHLEAERLKQVRMKGLVVAQEDVLRAMDRDIAPYSVDQVLNKDGSVSSRAKNAVDESTLRQLTDAALDKARELCERIRGGDCAASPTMEGERSACDFCDHRPFCRLRPENRRPLDTEITWREIVTKKTLSESKETGIIGTTETKGGVSS